MKAIKVDANGLFMEDVLVADNFQQTNEIITVPCPNGFYLPRWTGTTWAEGLTQAEIDAIKNIPKEPTVDDYLLELDYRLSIIELGL